VIAVEVTEKGLQYSAQQFFAFSAWQKNTASQMRYLINELCCMVCTEKTYRVDEKHFIQHYFIAKQEDIFVYYICD
jgi:hypothetical protein